VILVLGAGAFFAHGELGSHLTAVRGGVVSAAESQVGYATDPPDSYCNRFSAIFQSGTAAGCAPGLLAEEWCADFAAWTWRQGGVRFTYALTTGDLNSAAYSFYAWGEAQGTWHAVDSGYVPSPGDVAVYGLDLSAGTAVHVAVVTGYTAGKQAPDVVNGDGDRTGFSVVEAATGQRDADTHGGGPLSGYVAPVRAPVTPRA
jgi:CHAP domain